MNKAIIRVCLFVFTVTQKRKIEKSSNIGIAYRLQMVCFWVQRSKVMVSVRAKHIEGDRVAGVSYALY